MDTAEKGTISLRKANRHWNIPLTLLFDHLYGKIRSRKVGPVGVLITKEDQAVVFWVLVLQDVGLLINLQQLKMKVAKLTQTRPTPF